MGDFGRVFLFVWLVYYLKSESLNYFIHQSSRFYVLTPGDRRADVRTWPGASEF